MKQMVRQLAQSTEVIHHLRSVLALDLRKQFLLHDVSIALLLPCRAVLFLLAVPHIAEILSGRFMVRWSLIACVQVHVRRSVAEVCVRPHQHRHSIGLCLLQVVAELVAHPHPMHAG